jgi:GxxExxY protein
MNANERESLIHQVVGAIYEVSNILGAGFLEKVYERALLKELHHRGVRVQSQASFPVMYKNERVGEYFADLLVEEYLVVEIKCVEQFSNQHLAQCLNYLKASGKQVPLLVNFQRPKAEFKRVVLGL